MLKNNNGHGLNNEHLSYHECFSIINNMLMDCICPKRSLCDDDLNELPR